MKLFPALGLSFFVLSGAPLPKQPLTAAAQVHSLSPTVAASAIPVVLRGTVTATMPEWSGFAFQDSTDAIYISEERMRTRPPLKLGQIVEITGQTNPGNFAPMVQADSVRVLGTGPMPHPIHADWRYISSGACDNDYIELSGVVRSVNTTTALSRVWRANAIHIDLNGNLVWIYLHDTHGLPLDRLPDSNVRIKGVCIVFSNTRRQFEQNVVLASNASDIEITQLAPKDPFSVPATTVDHLFGFQPGGALRHRVKVTGVVTAVDGNRVFLQGDNTGLLVRSAHSVSVKVGDRAEAVGFPVPGQFSGVLEDALLRNAGSPLHLVPLPVTAAELTGAPEEHIALPDAMLIQVEAKVLDISRSAQEQTLVLQSGSNLFTARLKGWSRRERLPHVEAGTPVRVTGVCTLQRSDSGALRTFEVLMRSPRDLKILGPAPWLTRAVALHAIEILLGLVGAAAIWLILLRRRVSAQTAVIRRQLERESLLEKRFRDLIENASDMVYIRDLDGHLLLVNHGTEQLTGYSRQELIGMNILDLLVPEQRERAREQLRARPSEFEQEFETAEWRFLTKDGREVTVEVKQRFLAEDDENIRVEVIGRDVTARTRALADNQQRFRTLADNIAQLAWMADERGFIFWFNQRWFDYTDSSIEQARGSGWLKWHHPDHAGRVLNRIQHSFENGVVWEDTFPLRGRDGQYRWFLGKAMPIRDANGQVLRWFGTNTDITEQKQLESELQRSNRELQQFAYVASHDLQEPLRNVCAFTQLLARTYTDEELTPKRRDYINIITSGARRMERLIADLLAYSRIGIPKKAEQQRINFEVILEKTLQNLSTSLEDSGAQVTHGLLPVVEGSESQLSQVVQNLIANSIKYRRRDVALRVQVHAQQNGDHWLFIFADNGIGFDPQYAENVFGIFKRLHSHEIPGTGIGLAICKSIIERHGGRIWADARPGEGATFYFTIPDTQNTSGSEVVTPSVSELQR